MFDPGRIPILHVDDIAHIRSLDRSKGKS